MLSLDRELIKIIAFLFQLRTHFPVAAVKKKLISCRKRNARGATRYKFMDLDFPSTICLTFFFEKNLMQKNLYG
jgi:hypothetical protein